MLKALQQLRRIHGPGVIAISFAFITMAWISWRKWPDLLTDFGAQLYIPWKLSMGSVLYRDVMCLPGPLSPYYHALLFKIFGVSLNTILVSNFLILVVFVGMVYYFFYVSSDRLVATAAGLAVVLVFAFAQYLDIGNYNYICPYAHEIWHGTVLSVIAIAFLSRWIRGGEQKFMAIAGVCYGLTFLTKPENFFAATAAVVVAFVLRWKTSGLQPRTLFLFGASTCAPILFLFSGFLIREDVRSSFRSICWAWLPLVTTNIAGSRFYQTGLGLDAPSHNLTRMFIHFTVLAPIVFLCAWRFRPQQNRLERIVLFCALAAFAVFFDWTRCGSALPLIVLSGLGLVLWKWKRAGGTDGTYVFPILWLVYALFSLAKMGLNPRIVHYGTFLAMPAFIGGVYFLLGLLPSVLQERYKVNARYLRGVLFALLLIGFLRLMIHSALFYNDKNFPIGSPGDQIVVYDPSIHPASGAVAEALQWIERNTAPTNTLAVLPEGAMINYQARRSNPTPYHVFMAEVHAFGEERMFAAYKTTPPDYILLVHRDSSEYGFDYFGKTQRYGLEMMRWINENYRAVHLIGSEPLRNNDFGIKILKRIGNTQN